MEKDVLNNELRTIKLRSYCAKKHKRPFPCVYYAWVCMTQKNPEEADLYIEKALSTDNKYIPAIIGKIMLYVLKGDFRKAVKFYLKNKSLFTKQSHYRWLLYYVSTIAPLESVISKKVNNKRLNSLFFGNIELKRIINLFNKNKGTFTGDFLSLIAAIYSVSFKIKEPGYILENAVKLKFISDIFRWQLFKFFYDRQQQESNIKYISQLVSSFPENFNNAEIINAVIKKVIFEGNFDRVENILLDSKIVDQVDISLLYFAVSRTIRAGKSGRGIYMAANRLINEDVLSEKIINEAVRAISENKFRFDRQKDMDLLGLIFT